MEKYSKINNYIIESVRYQYVSVLSVPLVLHFTVTYYLLHFMDLTQTSFRGAMGSCDYLHHPC